MVIFKSIVWMKHKIIPFGSLTVGFYRKSKMAFLYLNETYKEYPLLFWVMGILLSLLLFVLKELGEGMDKMLKMMKDTNTRMMIMMDMDMRANFYVG